jgi:hypothetical protein
MKILFNSNNGKIFYPIYDKDIFSFAHTTKIPLTEFIIDEVAPDNKDICADLFKYTNKIDIDGDDKYYMLDNAGTWELHDKDGWEEYIPEIPEGF